MTIVEEKLLGAVSATSQALKLIALQIATKNDKIQALQMLTNLITVLDVSVETTKNLDELKTEAEAKSKKRKEDKMQSFMDMVKNFANQQEETDCEEDLEEEEEEETGSMTSVDEDELPEEIKELLTKLRTKFAGQAQIGVKAFRTN